MATNSFRKGTEPPPHQYRTPSPPTYAFEPLSPSEFDSPGYALGNKRRVETEVQNTPTIMDTFASIALAADPSRPSDSEAELLLNFSQAAHSTAPRLSLQGYLGTRRERQLPYTFEGQCAERPSKRARSEKLPSPEWHRTVSRPFTSYIQPQKCDSFLMPCRLVTGKDSYGLAPYISARHQQTDSQARSEDSVASGTGTAEQSEPLITRWSDQDVGVDNLHRTQDIRFAQLVATAAHVPPSHEAALEIGTFHEDSTTTVKDMGEMNRLSPLHVPRSPERFRSPIQYDAMLEARPRDLEDQPLTRDFSIIENSKIYFRDDQSTSTSMSACAEDSALAEGRVQAIEDKLTTAPNQQDVSGKPGNDLSASLETAISALEHKARQAAAPSICAACKFTRNSLTLETENNATSWIRCDACKSWFHFACAGFKSEREVRAVDKYRCRECKSLHGATTYVRKSSRAHAAIDYAGLNEGVLKSSDENPEHHYIKPIKEGIIKFNPEVFPRMRPELVTAEYFQQLGSFTQPVVIPALFNPRPGSTSPPQAGDDEPRHEDIIGEKLTEQSADNPVCYSHGYEHKIVPDHGQDALDMVLPQNLTVRKVAELYGPEEKVEVIDVKSQNGEDKKWNMRRWADYYESQGNKVVRNVISLEVSQSKLGRLIRRPKIVRDLDLQDSVWPAELQAKGEFPKVQFYCLMSVADCFTDFHIDFGGSSVFYHILKGKKTFFFIPPHEKHLKKYEEWCMSPAQNWTFLGDQTKECYRVDLSEGDTMLIPAGWIHAVWTPEDSLVIGGNFLTRMHYGMQINIAKIEKSTGVARKFRYPHFQKILWYTAIRYLEDDPLPDSVMEDLLRGNVFTREKPTHHEYVNPGEEFTDPERHHARYYSQAELDGLPDLGRYLLRTASIAMGYITEGISSETRNAVKRSIPKINAEPLDIVKKFGVWCAWKRGNEHIPHWARPDHVPEDGAPESGEKKLSAKAIRRLDREAALQAYRVAPERQSTRKRNQPQISTLESIERSKESSENPYQSVSETQSPGPNLQLGTGETFARKRKSIAGQPNSSPRKPACETCRKRRRACKHKDEVAPAFTLGLEHTAEASTVFNSKPIISIPSTTLTAYFGDWHAGSVKTDDTPNPSDNAKASDASNESMENGRRTLQMSHVEIVRTKSDSIHIPPELSVTEKATLPTAPQTPASKTVFNALASTEDLTGGSGASRSQARSKACKDCRKSKRRCLHDENGNEDPIKVREAAMPRSLSTAKKRKSIGGVTDTRATKKANTGFAGPSGPDLMIYPNDKSLSTKHIVHHHGTAPLAVPVNQASNGDTTGAGSLNTTSIHHRAELEQLVLQMPRMEGQSPQSPHILQAVEPAPLQPINRLKIPPKSPTPRSPTETPEDEVLLLSTSPLSDLRFNPEILTISPSHAYPSQSAATLVSPPASAHTDAEGTPPATDEHIRDQHQQEERRQQRRTSASQVAPSVTSSRHSSRQPKLVQRYTPESGTVRRRESSGSMSMGSAGTTSRRGSLDVGVMGMGERKEGSGKLGVVEVGVRNMNGDEESLRLVRELQAMEEYGLRRRRG